ncbi:MAG: iron ABC transporter permease [Chloroflexia bacterium]|nr:iron ABC transporter permease [Chloroflexia bacterium]
MATTGSQPSPTDLLPLSGRGTLGVGFPARWRRGRRLPPFVIWAPALIVVLLMAMPLVYLVLRASEAGSDVWRLVFRERTATVFRNTAWLAATVATASAIIAVPLAWLTTRTDLPLRRFWATVATLPLVIPSYVGALTIIAALGPRGLVQESLAGPLGIERLPSIYGFPGAWLTLTLFTFPYVFLSVRTALVGLDPALEEASRCLGRGSWRTFFGCVLPQLRPAIATGALLSALYTISDFGVVTLLRYDVFTRAVYVQYRSSFDRSLAAALALLLVLFAIVLLLAEAAIRGRSVYHRSGAGTARRQRAIHLGRWRWPALAFCGAVLALSLLLPLAVLLYWLARGLSGGAGADRLWSSISHSITAGGLAALAAAIAALPVAVLAVRFRGRLSAAMERATYLGYALPGIVIALAFVFVGANYLTPLYQTLGLLIVAYVVRFLPQAVGAERLSLLQVSPRLEEAARTLGRSSLGAIVAVTLPLARPGMLAGAALVFLTVMKELPITLLLSPIGFDTLATDIWSATGSGSFAEAAVPALTLIAISALPTVLASVRGGRSIDRPALPSAPAMRQ